MPNCRVALSSPTARACRIPLSTGAPTRRPHASLVPSATAARRRPPQHPGCSANCWPNQRHTANSHFELTDVPVTGDGDRCRNRRTGRFKPARKHALQQNSSTDALGQDMVTHILGLEERLIRGNETWVSSCLHTPLLAPAPPDTFVLVRHQLSERYVAGACVSWRFAARRGSGGPSRGS